MNDSSRARGAGKLRVLLFSPVSYFKGGAERSLLDLLDNPEIIPCVAAPAEGPILAEARSRGIEAYVVPFGSIDIVHRPFKIRDGFAALRSLWVAIGQLKEVCRSANIQVVHSNGLKAHVVNSLARLLGGRPAVVHIRDIPLTPQEKLVWRLLRFCADRVVMVSRACWPYASLPANVRVVHNGIEVPEVPVAPERNASGALVVGFIGRIDAAKGLHLLLDWMKPLPGRAETRLVVRGRFDSNDQRYEREVRDQVTRNGLTSLVRFEGFVTDREAVYRGIDVVCVPSHVPDPLPRSVMEPMAAGIPVIAYPAGGILEMITNEECGLLAANEPEFQQALDVLSSNTARQAIIKRARERMRKNFSKPLLYQQLNKIYYEVTNESNTTRARPR